MAEVIRIAIIDDDGLVAEGLARLLDGPDLAVVSVSSTLVDGVERILAQHPDVVLCDVMLDGIPGGLELPRRLRETFAAAIPVVLLSSFATDHLVDLARAGGAAGYVAKDSGILSLTASIRVVADGGQAFPRPSGSGERSPTPREVDVIRAVADGCSTDEAGRRLGISPRTVDAHLKRLFDRYGVASRTQLVVLAVRRGWIVELPR
jgi:DNA-binding NarL/FixJ family response regulator